MFSECLQRLSSNKYEQKIDVHFINNGVLTCQVLEVTLSTLQLVLHPVDHMVSISTSCFVPMDADIDRNLLHCDGSIDVVSMHLFTF